MSCADVCLQSDVVTNLGLQASEAGIKEMTLLGQNVNSYRYVSDTSVTATSTSPLGFSRISWLHTTPHAPCAMPNLVPILTGC